MFVLQVRELTHQETATKLPRGDREVEPVQILGICRGAPYNEYITPVQATTGKQNFGIRDSSRAEATKVPLHHTHRSDHNHLGTPNQSKSDSAASLSLCYAHTSSLHSVAGCVLERAFVLRLSELLLFFLGERSGGSEE